MKKYSLIKKANSRRTLLIKRTVLGGALGFFFVLALVFVPVLVSSAVAIVWYPFDSVRLWVAESGSSLPQYLRDRNELVQELEALKIKIATDAGTGNTIKKLQVENNQFREQIGAVPEARILARVIGRPNQLPYDMLLLDRGSEDSVHLGSPVFLGSDQVIGFVSKLFEKTALVTMVTTAGFTSSAYVIGPNIYTEAEGLGGGVLRVRVPQGVLLQTGNLVLLPALDSGVYGEVSLMETSPTQPEQYGYVLLNTALQSLYYVSIGSTPIVTNTFVQAQTVVAEATSKLFAVDVPLDVLVTPETSASGTSASSSTPVPVGGARLPSRVPAATSTPTP